MVSLTIVLMSGFQTCLFLGAAVPPEAVFVIVIGSKPGAETIPPEMMETGGALEGAVEVEDAVTLATSRTGAPRSIFPVANCSVYFFAMFLR